MVGGINDVIVGHDGEIIDALGATKSNLAGSVGITGRGSAGIAGQVSLDGGDSASVAGESHRQIIADVVGNSAHHSTGIGKGPDLRRDSGLVLCGNDQTALVRKPNKVMEQSPVPAGHGLLGTGVDVDLNQRA